MERLVALGTVLAFVSLCHTSTQKGVTVAVDGQIGIGLITGGHFGPGSFSVDGSGGGRPTKKHVYMSEDGGNGEHILIQTPSHHGGQQDNRPPQRESVEPDNSGGGYTQLDPVKPQTTHTISAQGGMGGESGSGGSHIYIDSVIVNNKNNKENKNENGYMQLVVTDANAILGSGGNNGFPGTDNGFSSTNGQTSIEIGSITGGNFAEGTGSLKNNNRPESNVLQDGTAVNDGNTRYPNAGKEALHSIGHGASNGAGNAGDGYNHGKFNSGHNSESGEERWIWSR